MLALRSLMPKEHIEMRKPKRPRLSEKQKRYLLMVESHKEIGSCAEFAPPDIRKLPHQLRAKGLLQWHWRDRKWIATPAGYVECRLIEMEEAAHEAA